MGFPVGTLHQQLLDAGIPLLGINIGDVKDRSTWVVNYGPGVLPSVAVDTQAKAVIAAFDVAAAQVIADAPQPDLNKIIAALVRKGVILPTDLT